MNTNYTAENVRRFLGNDFQTHRRKARLSNVLPSSPVWDSQPKSQSFGNSTDNNLVEYVHSKTLVEAVEAVLDVMSDKDTSRHASVLKLCFIHELDDFNVIERLNMSRRQFYFNKKNALLEFAELSVGIIDFSA